MGIKNSSRKVALIFVNYGYFYDSFFRAIALRLSKENEVHVWFEGQPRLVRAESVSLAQKDADSGLIADSRVFTPKGFSTSRRNNLGIWRSNYSKAVKNNLEIDVSFDQVYVLNSSRLATIAFLEAMKIKGSEIIVVRPMAMEARFRIILEKFRARYSSKMPMSFGFKLLFIQEVVKAFWAKRRVRKALLKPKNEASSSHNKDSGDRPVVFALPTRELFGYFYNSLGRGLKDWYESILFFANTRITSRVLVPSLELATLLTKVAPGPDYVSFSPPSNQNTVENDKGVGIFFPPGYISKTEIKKFCQRVEIYLSHINPAKITVRLHPHQSGAYKNLDTPEVLIKGSALSNLDFVGFVEAHSTFIVFGRTTSLPVAVKLLKPDARVISIPESEFSKVELDSGQLSAGWIDQVYDKEDSTAPGVGGGRNFGATLNELLKI